MPAIDWTRQGVVLTLAAVGLCLIVLGLGCHFLATRRGKTLALVAGIAGGLAAGMALGLHLLPAAPRAIPNTPHESSVEIVSDPISAPSEDKAPAPAKRGRSSMWYTVQRGDVVVTLVERGTIESADNAEVEVKVHAGKGGAAGTIKTIVADGATVKKGQVVVELDDAELRQKVKRQKTIVERSKTDVVQSEKQAALDMQRSQLDLEAARHQLVLAERDLKAFKGEDAEQKKGLELKVKEAEHLVKTRALQTTTTKTRADDLRRTTQAIVDGETAKLKDRETDLVNCKMLAPRDGQVFYHVDPFPRFGAPESSPAVGETVRAGQKLLYLPDLTKMQLNTRVHETQIARIRQDQTARVRIDAFPGQTLSGRVSRIAHVAAPADLFAADEMIYPVTVTLTDQRAELRPGMSAEVRIELERRDNVLRVPLQALLNREDKIVCFVKSGSMMRERPVTVGLRDALFAEIRDGLKEGEEVLRDAPRAAKPRAEDPTKPVVTTATRIVVSSVKPADDIPAGRTRISVYGITKEDEKRLKELPGVTRVVPLRIAVIEARRRDRRHTARIVGTTPAYREAYPLELAAGRFLSAEDEAKTDNVVVLGSDLAQTLFPGENALDRTVKLGTNAYRVVGVLKERKNVGEGAEAEQVNDDAYVPLETFRAHFGQTVTVRQAGRFVREQVYLHQLLLFLAKREQVRPTADEARTLLEAAHKKKDWQVQVIAAP